MFKSEENYELKAYVIVDKRGVIGVTLAYHKRSVVRAGDRLIKVVKIPRNLALLYPTTTAHLQVFCTEFVLAGCKIVYKEKKTGRGKK